MTKKEFFRYLEKRLAVLDKKERADILAEFDQHINNKIASGCTEEQAIADFGDLEQFVEEILEAYKVDPEYDRGGNEGFVQRLGRGINSFAEALLAMDKKQLLRALVKLAVLIVALVLVKLLINPFADVFGGLFAPFGSGVHNFFGTLIYFLLNLIYLVVFVYAVYLFIVKVFLEESGKQTPPSEGHYFKGHKKRKQKEDDSVEDYKYEAVNKQEGDAAANSAESGRQAEQGAAHTEPSDSKILADIKAMGSKFNKTRQEKQEQKTAKQAVKQNDDNSFVDLLKICLKILVVFLMLPVLAYLVFNAVGLVTAFIMMCWGLPAAGITIIALGSLLCVGVFTVFVFDVVFGGKKRQTARMRGSADKNSEREV